MKTNYQPMFGQRLLVSRPRWFGATLVALFVAIGASIANAGFTLGDAANFAVLFEGGGGTSLKFNNSTIDGNIGIGGTGKFVGSGPATLDGTIYFSAPDTGQFSTSGAITYNPPIGPSNPVYNSTTGTLPFNVQDALTWINNLNSTLGGETGTDVAIGTGTGKTLTINAASGTLDGNGNEVFNVTSFNTVNANVLTINGDGVHSVVLNFAIGNINFDAQVALNNIASDQVLFNFVGGSSLSGGPSLSLNNNASASSTNLVQGIFLDPNGPVSADDTRLTGRLFGGDTHDDQIVSGDTITAPVPEPETIASFMLGLLGLAGVSGMRRRRIRFRR